MNDAYHILYPVEKEEPKLPTFEKGKFYMIEFEVKEFIGESGGRYTFSGAEFAGKQYDSSWIWAKQLLIDAVPALGWEVRDMLEKKEEAMSAAAGYFKQYGTASE